MITIKSIPKNLLIHTAKLYREPEETENRWESVEPQEIAEVERIRIEPSSRIVRDKNNAEIQIAATLFFDCRNSRPLDIAIKEDDIIVFNGQKHSVTTVEPLYDNGRLHHYEIGLARHA